MLWDTQRTHVMQKPLLHISSYKSQEIGRTVRNCINSCHLIHYFLHFLTWVKFNKWLRTIRHGRKVGTTFILPFLMFWLSREHMEPRRTGKPLTSRSKDSCRKRRGGNREVKAGRRGKKMRVEKAQNNREGERKWSMELHLSQLVIVVVVCEKGESVHPH